MAERKESGHGLECARCRRMGSVQGEKVVRGNEPFVNYKCRACRYSWQVKDASKRQTRTEKRSTASSDEPVNDE